MSNFQKVREVFLGGWQSFLITIVPLLFLWLVGHKLPSLKSFLYHVGVLPFGDVADGLVATGVAGLVSLASAPVLFTRLYWLVEREGLMEVERGFFHDHAGAGAGFGVGQGDRHKEFFDQRKKLSWVWLSVHLLYFLVLSAWSFWRDGLLTAAFEGVFVGYVFSVLLVGVGFVLVMSLSKILVNIPHLEFKTQCRKYFLFYCTMVWVALLTKAIAGPIPLIHNN